MRTLERLYQKAAQQTAKHQEKRGYVCRDGADSWLCNIWNMATKHEEKQTFPTQEAAIAWGGDQIGSRENGYLIIFNF
jgi:hypothetical protein